MDPFTVRMNFKRAYLEKLTSSPGNQSRAAAYALKYREQDEDLHQCIFEVLDSCNINLRANIMFFIEHLCELSKREGHQVYIDMVERDMPKIINLVAPGTKAGAMNIKVVRKVLESLQHKTLLPAPMIQSLLKSLHNRETLALTSIATPVPQLDRSDGVNMLGENDIEQRMEEDRDRHKRLREDTWAVDPEEEFEQLWEQGKVGLTAKLLQDCWDDKRQLDKEIELDKLLYEKPVEREKENDIEMDGI
ncbi:ctd kinase subunit gamma [Venturia nashicola]|uniref:Ctd kinase subunit gamma n=1 Tax=Venturia nashicola TaxID=86259 RepID=A0A4Z1NPM3_9PEZI|nr:ctd kinase subunit gamma [Venturia nashicola]TLD20972.1 ctd kinase subunit gamma [Venturia nashicola]